MGYAAGAYIVYSVFLNLAFILLELINNFIEKLKERTRDIMFWTLVVLSIAVPLSYVVFLISNLVYWTT
ncbi:MAG: hypothetical protein GC178_15030 [Flavobacteriales bacterium]|nr:hypothetical protein [Flavobacteriales bacterium]